MSTTSPSRHGSSWTIAELGAAYDTLHKRYEDLKKQNDTTLALCEKMREDLARVSAEAVAEHKREISFMRELRLNLQNFQEGADEMIGRFDGGDSLLQGDDPAGGVGHEDGQETI
jgi:soluble cytochrome b562